MLRLIGILILVVGATTLLTAQTAAALKAKRQQLLQEIQANTKRLTSTRRDKAAALEQLTLLQNQIRAREELVTTLQQEVAQIEEGIVRTGEVVEALQSDVEQLKAEFSKLLQAAYRAKLRNSWLTFLLSSRSFNEAFRRWQYLRQYQRYRSRQTQLILATQRTLERKLTQLQSRRAEKASLLLTSRQQQQALANEQRAQDQLLGRLKRDEAGLLAQIKKQEAAREELNSAIEAAIVREMERMRLADRSGETASTESKADRTAANSSFSTQRGRLPWPVSGGRITRKFGRQQHPTVKSVEISNNGIDIAVEGGSSVKAVATGVVVSTHFVPGYRNMVLVRHGEYYTVYSNLESVQVTNGSSVTAGQVIGAIGAGTGDLHFEIWRQKERLNPERWISGR